MKDSSQVCKPHWYRSLTALLALNLVSLNHEHVLMGLYSKLKIEAQTTIADREITTVRCIPALLFRACVNPCGGAQHLLNHLTIIEHLVLDRDLHVPHKPCQ